MKSHLPSYFLERAARPLDFCFHFGYDITPSTELVRAEEVEDRVGRAGDPRVNLHGLPADPLDSTDGLDGEELFSANPGCQAYLRSQNNSPEKHTSITTASGGGRASNRAALLAHTSASPAAIFSQADSKQPSIPLKAKVCESPSDTTLHRTLGFRSARNVRIQDKTYLILFANSSSPGTKLRASSDTARSKNSLVERRVTLMLRSLTNFAVRLMRGRA